MKVLLILCLYYSNFTILTSENSSIRLHQPLHSFPCALSTAAVNYESHGCTDRDKVYIRPLPLFIINTERCLKLITVHDQSCAGLLKSVFYQCLQTTQFYNCITDLIS